MKKVILEIKNLTKYYGKVLGVDKSLIFLNNDEKIHLEKTIFINKKYLLLKIILLK